jgi:ketosteroid isomerase-like protein
LTGDADASILAPITRGASSGAWRRDTIMMAIGDLQTFFDKGWNKHDLDVLMTFMSDDCVFETAGGAHAYGTRYAGHERVREGFQGVFARFPDAQFRDTRHFVAGDRGVSEWTFTGTSADGRAVEVNGCDIFTFRAGKIALKSSYFKNRSA